MIHVLDPDISLGSLPWHLQPDQVDQGQQCFLQEELHLGFSTPAIQVKIYTWPIKQKLKKKDLH